MKTVKKGYTIKNHEALYVTGNSNISYLTGFHGSHGFVVLTPGEIVLFTDKRYLTEAKKKLEKTHATGAKKLKSKLRVLDLNKEIDQELLDLLQKAKVKQVSFEEKNLDVAGYKQLRRMLKLDSNRFEVKATQNRVERLRVEKTDEEIQNIKKAQVIAEKVFEQIKKYIKTGVTERALAWNIEKMGRELGAEGVSFAPLVCFGKNTAIPHHESDNTSLSKGDLVLLDFGFKYNKYCSDMTRVLFTKAPTKIEEEIYEIVLKAQKSAIDKIHPGISGQKADSFCRDIIEKAGYGENFTHSSGHGVGLEIHEDPNLSPKFKHKSDMKLSANMVVTVEPGIYLDGKFGIRIEDMMLIGKKGNTVLTKTPKTLKSACL